MLCGGADNGSILLWNLKSRLTTQLFTNAFIVSCCLQSQLWLAQAGAWFFLVHSCVALILPVHHAIQESQDTCACKPEQGLHPYSEEAWEEPEPSPVQHIRAPCVIVTVDGMVQILSFWTPGGQDNHVEHDPAWRTLLVHTGPRHRRVLPANLHR